MLQLYIETGIATAAKFHIMHAPQEKVISIDIEKEDIIELHPYKFPALEISIPDGFTVVQEAIKKVYYKKRRPRDKEAIIYVLRQERDFFVGLFPQLRSRG